MKSLQSRKNAPGRMSWILGTTLIGAGGCYPALAAPLPLGANDWTTLYATFDRDLHAGKANNPYSAGSGAKVVPGGLVGSALQGESNLSTLVYAGSNLPVVAGTIRIFVKNTLPANVFSDGKEYFIAAAERNAPVRYGTPEEMVKHPGFSFILYKNTDNELVLNLSNNTQSYIRLRGAEGGFPDNNVTLRLPAANLDANGWHEVIVSWDVPQRKYWLRLNEQVATGVLPESFRAGAFDYLQLTNSPNIFNDRQGAFPGLIDELLISDRPLPAWLAADAPKEAQRMEATPPNWPRSAAVTFKDEPLATYESQLRTALDNQARFQNSAGGWTLSFAYPSGMGFTSGKTRTPQPANIYGNSKDGTSTLAALRYAMAYEALGDKKYLDVAERAAQSLLRAQQKEGYWSYGWSLTDDGAVLEVPGVAPIEDHVQSAPILLLLYLNRLTGDAKYLTAAQKGIDFLISAQNANGSWSHHYNVTKKVGETASGKPGGGEFNDFTTTGTMKVMLLGYRMTGEKRFLDAYMKAADWILATFIDNSQSGGAVGWAQQYNIKNEPISARQFEPVAVENFASAMAASTLMDIYRMTGDAKYLRPAEKWVQWLQSKAPQYTFYHDIKTGRPIAAQDHKVYFLDEPAQAAAYKVAFEKTGQPYEIAGFQVRKDWVSIGEYAQRLETLKKTALATPVASAERPLPTRQEIEQQFKAGMTQLGGLSKGYNWTMAAYRPKAGTPGPRLTVGSPEWTVVAWTLARARALRGDLPMTHPLLRMPANFDTGQESEIVISHLDLYAPLAK